jgi:hypothetical protein
MMKTKILLLAGLLLASFSCKKDKPLTAPQAGLISYFNFDDNLKDQKGYASDGIPFGNPSFSAGKLGKAISLNGINQKVEVLATPTQSPVGVSIAFWMNVVIQQDVDPRIMVDITDKNLDYVIFDITKPNKLSCFIGTQAGSAEGSCSSQSWTHVAMTFNGTDNKLYLNGILTATNTDSGTVSGYFQFLNLGYHISYNKYLQGSIDELYIYNRALSPAEVTQLYNLK